METEINEHPLDYAYVDIEPDRNAGNWAFYALFLATLFLGGLVAVALFTPAAPPVVTFPAPASPKDLSLGYVVLPNVPSGWQARCLDFDGDRKAVQPNWGDPDCTAAAAKKAGWW